jgi:flagellin
LSDEEVRANQLQIDSILSSLDRIANTTTFAGKKLLDGSEAYLTSNNAASAIPSIQLFSVRIPENGTRNVRVEVAQSAQAAQITFTGNGASGGSTTSASTVVVRGTLGTEVLTFASGATLSQIAQAINNNSITTGVSASVSAASGGSALVLNSTTLGEDAFVSVAPIAGNFVEANNFNTTIRADGIDAIVLVDGQQAAVNGLEVDVRSGGLDASFILSRSFAQTLSSAEFAVTGGGSLFQLTPQVTPNGQVHIGLNAIATTELGDPVTGRLYSIRSGAQNALEAGNFLTAQNIVAEAISQVAFYRGRLGNIQKNQIETNINSQRIALENVTASESVIRDADMAAEVSNLTRAQILVQSTQATLQIANSVPNLVLSLLTG